MDGNLDLEKFGYRIVERIGSNYSFGRGTYKGENIADGSSVAIKHFQFPKGAQQADYFSVWDKDYNRELENLKRLDHPKIPKAIDNFEIENNDRFIVLEFKNGKPLSSQRIFTPPEIREIIIQVLEVLVYLQEGCVPHVLHRDIKPENIIVDNGNGISVFLVDFGFSRIVGGDVRLSSVFYRGSRGFIAPEQALNREVSKALDLYGLGVTIACLVAGIQSINVDELFDFNNNIVFDNERFSGYSNVFIDWLRKMSQSDPKKRYKSAKEALESFKKIYVRDLSEIKSIPISVEVKNIDTKAISERITTPPRPDSRSYGNCAIQNFHKSNIEPVDLRDDSDPKRNILSRDVSNPVGFERNSSDEAYISAIDISGELGWEIDKINVILHRNRAVFCTHELPYELLLSKIFRRIESLPVPEKGWEYSDYRAFVHNASLTIKSVQQLKSILNSIVEQLTAKSSLDLYDVEFNQIQSKIVHQRSLVLELAGNIGEYEERSKSFWPFSPQTGALIGFWLSPSVTVGLELGRIWSDTIGFVPALLLSFMVWPFVSLFSIYNLIETNNSDIYFDQNQSVNLVLLCLFGVLISWWVHTQTFNSLHRRRESENRKVSALRKDYERASEQMTNLLKEEQKIKELKRISEQKIQGSWNRVHLNLATSRYTHVDHGILENSPLR